jgi:hypothetical protein
VRLLLLLLLLLLLSQGLVQQPAAVRLPARLLAQSA